jgi:uncharacterized protein
MGKFPALNPSMPAYGATHASAPWPYELLDAGALRTAGWQPVALREFVLKVHQRCNLSCDYCYVYTMPDQSWRSRPVVMDEQVWNAAAARIAEHSEQHELDEVWVVLHGGEPLLAGRKRLVAATEAVRSALPAGTIPRFSLQTNGVLLDEPTLRALRDHEVHIGVSLDGGRRDHDRHRRYADGRSSFDAVERALSLLREPEYRHLYSGLLATIDPATDPVACYEAALAYDPPAAGFLLPHANWSTPPPTTRDGQSGYGEWLVRLFDRWYDAPHQETRVNLFESIIDLTLGGAGSTESVGLGPAVVAVVETDGDIEQVDALKSAYEGAAATGLSVLTDAFDDALKHPGFVARQIGAEALSGSCRECPIHRVCGGGQYPHRYRAGAGFRNPSVYCPDLWRVITHIQARVRADLDSLLANGPEKASP